MEPLGKSVSNMNLVDGVEVIAFMSSLWDKSLPTDTTSSIQKCYEWISMAMHIKEHMQLQVIHSQK